MKFADYTFVVSCRRHAVRRRRFTEQAVAAGLEHWGFFDAYDGEALQLATATPSAHGRAGRPAPLPLGPGELGCLLSHSAIWRTMAALPWHRTVCVLEDDCEFTSPTTLAAAWAAFMAEVPEGWLMVHGAGDPVLAGSEPVPVSERCARVVGSYGTRFMLLSPAASYHLARLAEDAGAAEPADWLLGTLFATGRVYCPREPLFRHADAPGIGLGAQCTQ